MKINEGIRAEELRFCLLCGSKGVLFYQNLRDRLFGVPGIWSLMRCPECGLVWLNPMPVPENIGKLYANYFTHSIDDRTPKFSSLRRFIRNSILAQIGYSELAEGFLHKVTGLIFSRIGPFKELAQMGVMCLNGKQRGKLLDVGCGSGAFLSKMKALGWEVVGVEPDKEAVKVAREKFGLDVYEGTLEEVSFPKNEFDAITMNHVVEHLYDPIATLRECRRVLKPGGKLVVVTPNIKSLGARLFGKAWLHWDPPRHLYLFSPSTLQTLAGKAGLKVLQLRTTARSARGMWAASYLIRRNGTLPGGSPQKVGPGLRLTGLAFQLIEHGLCVFGDVGEEIVMIATK